MWTLPVVSECGWAFSWVTRPWVAQRVWPMPVAGGPPPPRPGPANPAPPPLPRPPARRGPLERLAVAPRDVHKALRQLAHCVAACQVALAERLERKERRGHPAPRRHEARVDD